MFSRSNNSLWKIYLSFHVPSLCALCNTLALAWVILPHIDWCMLATWSRDWEDPVGNILALDEVAAWEERTMTYKVPSAPTCISCSSDILTTSRAVYALFSHVIKNKSSVTCSQRSVFICSRSTEMERPPQLAAHHLVSWSSFGTPKPNSSWRKLNQNTHPACDFQPPIGIQSIGSGQRWDRVKPRKLPSVRMWSPRQRSRLGQRQPGRQQQGRIQPSCLHTRHKKRGRAEAFHYSWAAFGITARGSGYHLLPEIIPGSPAPASFLGKRTSLWLKPTVTDVF